MDRPTLAVFILHSLWAALGRRLLPTARLRKNSAQQAQWRLCREGPRISLTPKQGTQAPHSTDRTPPGGSLLAGRGLWTPPTHSPLAGLGHKNSHSQQRPPQLFCISSLPGD